MMEPIKEVIDPELLFAVIEEELASGHKASFTVTGTSMWPLICHKRDKVIVSSCSPGQLRHNDIILFRTPVGNYMLHRITTLREDAFETTGDGNCFRDGWFPRECVKARVDEVIRNGKTIDCSALIWRLYGTVWNMLFPIRRHLLCFLKKLGYIKAKIRSFRNKSGSRQKLD